MATLTAPKSKGFKPKTPAVAATLEATEAELWEKAAQSMQQMALNATAVADVAASLVEKLDGINVRLTDGGSRARR